MIKSKFKIPVSPNYYFIKFSYTARNSILREPFKHYTVNKPPPGLLQFKTMSKRFPWHLVVLLGSGFALAEACKVNSNLYGILYLKISLINSKTGLSLNAPRNNYPMTFR